MVFKVEVDYTGRTTYILEAPGKEEAVEMAVEKFEDKNPGMFVTGKPYVETLSQEDLRELKHADAL